MSVRWENVGKKTSVGVMFNTVTISIVCGDAYEAQIVYDDIIERIQSGEGVDIGLHDYSLKVKQET